MTRVLDTFTSRAELKSGKLILDKPSYFKGMLMQFSDCKVRVVVERLKKEKSRQQRGYYWGVVLPIIAEHVGHTPERLHDIFKQKYLLEKVLWRGGDIHIPKSTEELTSNEYAEYVSNIILEASELGIVVPEPDKELAVRRTI